MDSASKSDKLRLELLDFQNQINLEKLKEEVKKLQEDFSNNPTPAEIDARIKEDFRRARVKAQTENNKDKSSKEAGIVEELTWEDVRKMDAKTINENWESIKKIGVNKKY